MVQSYLFGLLDIPVVAFRRWGQGRSQPPLRVVTQYPERVLKYAEVATDTIRVNEPNRTSVVLVGHFSFVI